MLKPSEKIPYDVLAKIVGHKDEKKVQIKIPLKR